MKKKAIRFIVMMGIVSLLADITYEGARSITGPYLAILGASGAAVGIVVGLGELIGYGIRVVSGYAADRTRAYWVFTFIGYTINLLAVPLLALAGNWQTAAILIVLERLGKGLRTPARDAMLSFAAKRVGRGFGFGLHEALDQIGALTGPLIMAAVLFYQQHYQVAFACLAIPALGALGMLTAARISFPRPHEMEIEPKKLDTSGFSRKFWTYVLGASLVGAGFVDFALLAYHFQKSAVLSPVWIPLFYAMAMAIDGIAALWMGKVFDVKGISLLASVTAIASLFAPLIFFGGFWAILAGMLLWGIGMGAQESIMRSYVAVIIPASKRASAYGILYLGFGLFWFLGSSAIGYLYDNWLSGAVAFSMLAQIAGAALYLVVKRY
ncbi:MAG: MFS transporter [Verrucomicrobia bacterium]|nr:MFS transporter [Verrucomicrobiota bacterium]